MGRIHPTDRIKSAGREGGRSSAPSSLWTVWKKSSMAFQGTDGFSVYDSDGKLAFRVDNYSRRHKELVLMDGDGEALLSLRPQMFSMHDQWYGFKGTEETSKARPKSQVFSIRRRSILQNSDEAEVFMGGGGSGGGAAPDFRIEGSFWRRSCKIRSKSGEVAARISRKKASESVVLSDDVFSLEIGPGADCELVMAFVVILDRICRKPYAPLMCSAANI